MTLRAISILIPGNESSSHISGFQTLLYFDFEVYSQIVFIFKTSIKLNLAGREISTPRWPKLLHICHKFRFPFEYIKIYQIISNEEQNIIEPS